MVKLLAQVLILTSLISLSTAFKALAQVTEYYTPTPTPTPPPIRPTDIALYTLLAILIVIILLIIWRRRKGS